MQKKSTIFPLSDLQVVGDPQAVSDPQVSSASLLDSIVRQGAQRLLQQAIEAEVAEYIERHAELTDANGRKLIVRNGTLPSREIATTAGRLSIRQPRVRDRRARPDQEKFTSAILPAYARRSPSLEVLLPVLYLKGISTGDVRHALASLLGPSAAGLSATTITRLSEQWQQEHRDWSKRDLWQERYVYLWADGIYSDVRLSDDRPCLLVLIGVTATGKKQLLAVADGQRESYLSWKEVLLDLRDRGLTAAPLLAVGDGALGFWKALSEVYPSTQHQLCWVHKTANVLNALPKKLQSSAKSHLHTIYTSSTQQDARKQYQKFLALYQSKYPKACASLERNIDRLLSFYGFPAQHWQHVRSTNVIESAFATIRHRQRQTKGNGSAGAAVAMIYKLGREAEKSWRRLNGHQAIEELLNGVVFVDGEPSEVRQASQVSQVSQASQASQANDDPPMAEGSPQHLITARAA